MARGFARKAFYLALILLGVSILCFALLRLSGRDPALAVALRAQSASEENIAQLREELGLTGTPVQQYFRWLSGFVRGDFGYSIYSGRSVALDIAEKLPVTCALMGLALGWILLLGTPVALCAAYRPGKLFDQIGRVLSILAICVPTFWLAYMPVSYTHLTAYWEAYYEPFVHDFTWEEIHRHAKIMCKLFNWKDALEIKL